MVYKENVKKWPNSFKLGDLHEAPFGQSFLFVLKYDTIGPSKNFYQPSNIMVTRNSENTLLTELMTYNLQVYRQLMITYVPNDFKAFLT